MLHPKRSFHGPSTLTCDRLGEWGALSLLVAIQVSVPGLYFPPCSRVARGAQCITTYSTPNDHFAAGPDCGATVLEQEAR